LEKYFNRLVDEFGKEATETVGWIMTHDKHLVCKKELKVVK